MLVEIEEVLDADGETNWIQSIRKSKVFLSNSDFYGIEKLLGLYGGMSSFSDLVIGQNGISGKFAWKENAKEENEKLDVLRSRAYELAREIRRKHERETV